MRTSSRLQGHAEAPGFQWVTSADQSVQPLEIFAAGKIDVFLAIPPEPQELAARLSFHIRSLKPQFTTGKARKLH